MTQWAQAADKLPLVSVTVKLNVALNFKSDLLGAEGKKNHECLLVALILALSIYLWPVRGREADIKVRYDQTVVDVNEMHPK